MKRGKGKALQKRTDESLTWEAASSIAEGRSFASLEEFANAYGISVAKAVALLSSAEFVQVLRQITKAKATLAFTSFGVSRLVEIAQSENEAYAQQAIRTLGEIDGTLKSKKEVSVKISLEGLMAEAAKEAVEGGVEDVFEIEGL
jgi:hypothetical protein